MVISNTLKLFNTMIDYNTRKYELPQKTTLLLVHLFRSVPILLVSSFPGVNYTNICSWRKAGYVEHEKASRFSKSLTTTKRLQERFFNVKTGRKTEFFSNHDVHGYCCLYTYLIALDGQLVELEREKEINKELTPDFTLKIKQNSDKKYYRIYMEIETGKNTIDQCLAKVRKYNEAVEDSLEDIQVHFYVPLQKLEKYKILQEQTKGYELLFFDLQDMPVKEVIEKPKTDRVYNGGRPKKIKADEVITTKEEPKEVK